MKLNLKPQDNFIFVYIHEIYVKSSVGIDICFSHLNYYGCVQNSVSFQRGQSLSINGFFSCKGLAVMPGCQCLYVQVGIFLFQIKCVFFKWMCTE